MHLNPLASSEGILRLEIVRKQGFSPLFYSQKDVKSPEESKAQHAKSHSWKQQRSIPSQKTRSRVGHRISRSPNKDTHFPAWEFMNTVSEQQLIELDGFISLLLLLCACVHDISIHVGRNFECHGFESNCNNTCKQAKWDLYIFDRQIRYLILVF